MSGASNDFVEQLRVLEKALDGVPQSNMFTDSWNWAVPPIDKTDLSFAVACIADKVESVAWDDSNDHAFTDLTKKTKYASTQTVPNLWQNPQASVALIVFLWTLDQSVEGLMTLEQIRPSLVIPTSVRRSIDSLVERLGKATASVEGVEVKVASINSAYDAAEKLPTTQAELSVALAEVKRVSDQIEQHRKHAVSTSETVGTLLKVLQEAQKEASAALDRTRAAYRAATSEGLAHSFSTKSETLKRSVIGWTIVLVLALAVAFLIGNDRFPMIIGAVTDTPNWGAIFVRMAVGALSLAPPIWIAWIATKQIGQRFRLSEDYAYKAALSAAYEGYRTEASHLDPLLQARLFATALGRLDEIPLRLVEKDVYGSPVHELMSSPEFKAALDQVPGLKDRAIAILRSLAGRFAPSGTKSMQAAGDE